MDIAGAFIARSRYYLISEYPTKIQRCLDVFPGESLWVRDDASENSVGNLLLHLSGNARQWIVAGVGGADDARERQAEFDAGTARAGGAVASPPPGAVASSPPGAAELLARLRVTLAEVDAVLARLEPRALLERRRIQGLDDVVVLDAVFHVVEHFSMHTGQIIMLTKMITAGGLNFYDFSAGAPRHNWQKSD